MDAAELALLREPRSYPAVSLIMPTHRHAPENKQDSSRLRNLLDEAVRLLRQQKHELPHGVADEVTRSLEKAAGEVDLQHTAEALVLLAAPDEERHAFVLPQVNVTERVVIDNRFVTRDLVAAMEYAAKYWVLVLSEQPTRLWSGDGERLTEVSGPLFPVALEESPADARGTVPGRTELVLERNDQRDRFFRTVERNMDEVQKADPRPIVLLGVARSLSYMKDHAGRRVSDAVIGSVEGAFEKASAAELSAHVEPVLREARANRQRQALAELGEARSARRLAAGFGEVRSLAGEGRIERLLVEEGYFAEDLPAGSWAADPVDELIGMVLSTDGQVMFVPDDALADHDRVAAVLRY